MRLLTAQEEQLAAEMSQWAETTPVSAVASYPGVRFTSPELHRQMDQDLGAAADHPDTSPNFATAVKQLQGGRPTLDHTQAVEVLPSLRIRLPETLEQCSRDLARKQGRPLDDLVRQAIAEYVDRAQAA